MKKNRNRSKWNVRNILSAVVFLSLILSIVFLVIRLFIAPGSEQDHASYERTKSDYVLMLLQCSLGVLAMILPGLISKRMRIEIPSVMYILFVIFLYCAIYLGEVRNFYYNISNWDTILHGFSGAMLGALGFSFVALLNKSDRVPINLSPLFVVIFAFCFAVTLGVFWEIYEFSFDGLLGLNMQKAYLEDGTALVGRTALMDTMKDLIVDAVGAMITCIIGYISLKYKKGWIEKLQIKRNTEQ
ncbi:MAG: hypothetical protein HFE39_04175 [Clostridiales bacterium]|jgi:hypothetical protein|nr:hypothetical protein [Clostridiales bacterium]